MKKMCIILVLLMASTSFANVFYNWEVLDDGSALSGDILQGSTITYIVSTGTGTGQVPTIKFFETAIFTVGKGTFVSATKTGGSWSITPIFTPTDTGDGFTVQINGSNGLDPIADINTELFRIVFTADVLGSAAADATSGKWGSAALAAAIGNTSGIDVNLPYTEYNVIVPEPMTIMLLGLGGLFLRRRIA